MSYSFYIEANGGNCALLDSDGKDTSRLLAKQNQMFIVNDHNSANKPVGVFCSFFRPGAVV